MARKVSHERIGEILKKILLELKRVGGEARIREVFAKVEPSLNLTKYEKEVYEKTGYIRWQSIIHFYSIACIKAGYITKSGGKWKLTAQGEKGIKKSDKDFVLNIDEKYRSWSKANKAKANTSENDVESDKNEAIVRQTTYDQAKDQARQEVETQIHSLGPYDFQKLVAELLAAMGYHIRSNAPPGPDGGIDIVAYTDPLGTKAPRIRVQVKHRPTTKMNVKDVREMLGLLRQEGDVGLLVSSGGFTSEVDKEIRGSSRHIDTMDMDRLILLWEKNYEKVSEVGKALLPLVKLYFLAPTEE